MQFAYGEDGVDVMNVSYLREFGFLSQNAQRFSQQLNLKQALQETGLNKWEEEARALSRSAFTSQPCLSCGTCDVPHAASTKLASDLSRK